MKRITYSKQLIKTLTELTNEVKELKELISQNTNVNLRQKPNIDSVRVLGFLFEILKGFLIMIK